jgi:hypothetical protein
VKVVLQPKQMPVKKLQLRYAILIKRNAWSSWAGREMTFKNYSFRFVQGESLDIVSLRSGNLPVV